jgi:hypothetical protein
MTSPVVSSTPAAPVDLAAIQRDLDGRPRTPPEVFVGHVRRLLSVVESLTAETERLRGQVERVRALCHSEGYTTWDQGEPPWGDDVVYAWEAAHGHDIRTKCYAEFGCQLLVDPVDVLAALAEPTGDGA